MKRSTKRGLGTSVAFALLVSLCLAQIAWWTVFHFLEARRLEAAGAALERNDAAAALRALGAAPGHTLAQEAHRRLVMFTSEGAVLGIVVLLGVLFFYLALLRERRARAAQERFLTGATHALKSPLATLRLGLESLQQDRTPSAKRERYLGAMLSEVERLERDVQNALAAARIDAPRAMLRLETGDLAADLEQAIAAMQPRADAAQVQLSCTLEPARVSRDVEAMRLVLHNLLDNAVKYSSPGGAVTIMLRNTGRAGVLVVADQGSGIDPSELTAIFERFYRGRDQQHTGGTGLGLYLARELVHAHGGSLDARSEGVGRGSAFTVLLPLVEAR